MSAAVAENQEPAVLHHVSDGIGWLYLNRPKALNAVNIEMVAQLRPVLDNWALNPQVSCVVLQGKGRAFCAGGDIKSVFEFNKSGQFEKSIELFQTEYELNLAIHKFPKPYISLLDGLTMGGGMGLSMHGSHRVATENTVMAMPETAIGFFPDVGAGWFLTHAKDSTGMYLALTSNHIKSADAVYAGFATHYLASKNIPQLLNDLKAGREIEETLCDLSTQPEEDSVFEKNADVISRCFGKSSLESIFSALEEDGSAFAKETLQVLRTRSPLSLKVAFDILSSSCRLTIDEVMDQDLHYAKTFAVSDEFMEGIRAAVIDKDRKPAWPSGVVSY